MKNDEIDAIVKYYAGIIEGHHWRYRSDELIKLAERIIELAKMFEASEI